MYLVFFHCSDGLWHLTPSRVFLCRKISWHGDTGRCAQTSCTHDFIANPQGVSLASLFSCLCCWFSISCCFANQPFLGGLTFQFMVVVCGLLFKSATLVCSEFIGGVRKGGAVGCCEFGELRRSTCCTVPRRTILRKWITKMAKNGQCKQYKMVLK